MSLLSFIYDNTQGISSANTLIQIMKIQVCVKKKEKKNQVCVCIAFIHLLYFI